MRNLGRCLLGVLAMALRQPYSTQVQPFRRALTCVRWLLDFTMMAQYWSHISETIDYMEEYVTWFYKTNNIFLEFRVSKRTEAKADKLPRELHQDRNQLNQSVAQSKTWGVRDEDSAEENDQRMELIHTECNLNFSKIYPISHFHDYIYQFGNIKVYSTEFGELAQKEQIKNGWPRSYKIDAAQQILNSYWAQYAIRMRLLNLEFLRDVDVELAAEVLNHLEKTTISQQPPSSSSVLKGRHEDICDVIDFGRVCDIPQETICQESIQYSPLNFAHLQRLPKDTQILHSLPIELLTQPEIPILAFQESDVYEIYRAWCTGSGLFCNHVSHNDCVWIQTADQDMYGTLRGHLSARLLALFKIRDYTKQDTVHWLAAVQYLSVVNQGCASDVYGLVTIQLSDFAEKFTIVVIGTILSLGHLIPETDCPWLVNNCIDLRTFNEIYWKDAPLSWRRTMRGVNRLTWRCVHVQRRTWRCVNIYSYSKLKLTSAVGLTRATPSPPRRYK